MRKLANLRAGIDTPRTVHDDSRHDTHTRPARHFAPDCLRSARAPALDKEKEPNNEDERRHQCFWPRTEFSVNAPCHHAHGSRIHSAQHHTDTPAGDRGAPELQEF
jgi:hypothetical protein